MHLRTREPTLRGAQEFIARTPDVLPAKNIAIIDTQTRTVELVRGSIDNLRGMKGVDAWPGWKEGQLQEPAQSPPNE